MPVSQKITNFLGIVPRTAERLLPDLDATIAESLILTSGEIRPTRTPLQVYNPATGFNYYTAYRAYYNATEKWRTWTVDVNVCKGPTSPDVEPRYYISSASAPPMYSTFSNFGATDWLLGVPNPTTTATCTPSGGTGSTVSRVYYYTFYNSVTMEESGPSPATALVSGKVDGTWAIAGMEALPANSGSGTAANASGVTTVTNTGPHWLRVGDTVTISAVDYVVTVVSGLTFKFAGALTGAVAWTRKYNMNTTGLVRRLYRTTGTTATIQLVADNISTTTYSDTLTDAQILGDEMISSGWLPPPTDLQGFITLPNGAVAAFRKNMVCFSEPYQPHAWPVANQYQVESTVVGIESFGTTVVAATQTKPYYGDGVTPDVYTFQSIDNVWPCLSKRSVCAVGDGVIYATTHGMAYIGTAGPKIWTQEHFTIEEWPSYNPASMHTAQSDGKIYVLYTVGGTSAVMKFYPGEQAMLTTIGASANALYADALNGQLYFVSKDVSLFNGTAGSLSQFVWKSKEYELPERVNLGAGLVEWEGTMSPSEVAAAYALQASDKAANQAVINSKASVGAFGTFGFNTDPLNGTSSINNVRDPAEFVIYTLYNKATPVASVQVVSGKPFRLPSGYKTDVIAHQLAGNVRVKYIKVAETMTLLKAV